MHIASYTARRFLLPSLLAGLAISGCEPLDSEGVPYDRDLDPATLAEEEGKADASEACAGHPGGSLSGDDLLIIINKDPARQLQDDWSPQDLVPIDAAFMVPGREGFSRIVAVQAFYELVEAARAEAGLELVVRSAYRSYSTQCYTFNYWVETSGYEHAAAYSARPGRSEHQLGTALDITSRSLGYEIEPVMGTSAEGIWLAGNAHRFGFGLSYPEGQEYFTGYGYEPWHWRYIGREAAREMNGAGLSLLEYLLECDQGGSELTCLREATPEIEPNQGFIGGGCQGPEDCDSLGAEASCLDDPYVGGSCTVPCERYCPDRPGLNAATFCVADESDPSTGLCHSRCDFALFPDAGCREGYACQTASRPNGAGEAPVCLPAS
jgi:LAS superfamily LD-carboxypeptidase LdcB